MGPQREIREQSGEILRCRCPCGCGGHDAIDGQLPKAVAERRNDDAVRLLLAECLFVVVLIGGFRAGRFRDKEPPRSRAPSARGPSYRCRPRR
jgi:hypothetical protein